MNSRVKSTYFFFSIKKERKRRGGEKENHSLKETLFKKLLIFYCGKMYERDINVNKRMTGKHKMTGNSAKVRS